MKAVSDPASEMQTWTWQSMIPGVSVCPVPSMTSVSEGVSAPEVSVAVSDSMAPAAMSTSCSYGRKVAPSNTRTLRTSVFAFPAMPHLSYHQTSMSLMLSRYRLRQSATIWFLTWSERVAAGHGCGTRVTNRPSRGPAVRNASPSLR